MLNKGTLTGCRIWKVVRRASLYEKDTVFVSSLGVTTGRGVAGLGTTGLFWAAWRGARTVEIAFSKSTLYRVEKGVTIQAPLLNLLNRKAGYINERLRYIASSLPRLTYTPHPRFVVDSVIQRSLLCKDGLHFCSRGSVQVVVDLEKDISTVRASLHAAQKRPPLHDL
jgi:hypothetical protein